MNEITPEQKEQLTVWAGQRDSLLSEISIFRTEKETLTKTNKSLSDSNSEIQESIIKSIGRMSELDKQESDYNNIVSTEIHESLIQKTRLQGEVSQLEKQVVLLVSKKDLLIGNIEILEDVHDRVFRQVNVLDKVVNHVVKVNDENIAKVDALVSNLEGSVQKVININQKNVDTANVVIAALPRILFDLQKPPIIKNS